MDELETWIINHRRHLHGLAEPSHKEVRTREYIQQQLDALGIERYSITGKDVVGVIRGSRPGRTVAIRADMDGLSVAEETELPFACANGETMHACGHDGHMAIVLGVAKLFAKEADLEGEIRLLFQHAEEAMPGGAREIVAAGGLEDVDAILGCHLWQPLPTGVVGIRNGATMAGVDGFEITLHGRGGHGSTPDLTIDPTLLAAHFVTQVHTILSRSMDPTKNAVLSIGKIASGENYNVIPDQAVINGTVRYFDVTTAQVIETHIRQILDGVTRSFGGTYDLTYTKGDPALVNDATIIDGIEPIARKIFGDDKVVRIEPMFASEDFSYYSQVIPSGYIFIGVGSESRKHGHHSPLFDIAEEVLAPATQLLYDAARKSLSNIPPLP